MEQKALTCTKCGKSDALVGLYGTLPADFKAGKIFKVPGGPKNLVFMHLACAKEV